MVTKHDAVKETILRYASLNGLSTEPVTRTHPTQFRGDIKEHVYMIGNSSPEHAHKLADILHKHFGSTVLKSDYERPGQREFTKSGAKVDGNTVHTFIVQHEGNRTFVRHQEDPL